MQVFYLITSGSLIVYLVTAWFVGTILGLTGVDLWVLRGCLATLGITAAGLFVWWKHRSKSDAAAEPASEGRDELDLLVRDADARLAASQLAQGAALGNLPAVFLMGDTGATKTSVVMNSGMEPELLAGQVYQDNVIAPTRSTNIWFARQAIFVEAGGKVLADQSRWSRLVRRLRPGKLKSVVGAGSQAPRAALVCLDCDVFTRASSGEAVAAAARVLQVRLGEISQQFGISFPVYALFTKADRLPFFSDYVRNLSNEEAGQVLGVTLPVQGFAAAGVYGDEQTRRLSDAFNELFHSLCDQRLNILPREHDPARLPGAYEFPREFRKLRTPLVQFLVDLCRPSQLRASPFLRGFYFCGVRPIVVNELAAVPVARPAQAFEAGGSATRMFKAGGQGEASPAPPQVVGSRKVPQWLFLSQLFHAVILQDRVAMAASGASTKTNSLQRALLLTAIVLGLVYAVALLVSFVGNRRLESDSLEAAQAIPSSDASGANLAAIESLRKLETLRQSLEELTTYQREGAPLRLRWGLYAGSELYPAVRRAYYTRFRQLLFGQPHIALLQWLQRVPASPDPSFDYGTTYDNLKAYLITTSNHDKSTKLFLAPLLENRWIASREIDGERRVLARKQFDFYSEDLKLANPFSAENDTLAVERARRYLAQFSGTERVYQFMLAEASRTNPAINFNQRFAGSAEVVVNNKDVAGAFSKAGWDFMQKAIKRADQFFGGEKWVLGDYASSAVDRAKLEKDLGDRYSADYIAQWRTFLRNSSVNRYANLKDAAKKLNTLSGNQTPLLALFWLATQNTAVDSPKVTEAFQPVHAVVPPPASAPQYVLPPNQAYMNALLALQTSIDQASNAPTLDPAVANQTLGQATSAKVSTRQIAQAFRIDQEGQVHALVQKLMEDPITNAEALLRGAGPAELNGKGRALCAQFAGVTNKFPFNPNATAEVTLPELNALLGRPAGAFWAFYEASLKSVLTDQGGQYVASPGGAITLNPAFVNFFNQAARFSKALYPGSTPDPQLRYSLQPLRSDQVQNFTLTIDGQTGQFTGQGAPKQYVWPGATTREAKLRIRLTGGSDLDPQDRQGLWAVFRFFADANQWTPSGAGYNLTWVVTQGREGRAVMVGGRELTYRFYLDTAGGPPVFQKEWLAGLRCVSQVAR